MFVFETRWHQLGWLCLLQEFCGVAVGGKSDPDPNRLKFSERPFFAPRLIMLGCSEELPSC